MKKMILPLLISPIIFCAGCVSGNKASLIDLPESHKSTTAENVTAYGNIAAGAWDRLFTQKGSE